MRTLKKAIPPTIRAKIGRSVRNFNRKPSGGFGHDFIGEMRSRLPNLEVRTIFDVGAHIGSTALEYSDSFPRASVYTFEPGLVNFTRQEIVLQGKPDIKRYRIGFGAEERTASLFTDPEHPSMGRLVEGADSNFESVKIDTVDNFCAAHSINSIDLMKIDTEGHEIPVLRGARKMLRNSRIGVIKAEVAIDPDMRYHTPFFEFVEMLSPFGYRLFGIYEQCENEFSPGPRIRRFDAAFISPTIIARHMRGPWIAAPE